MEQRRAVVFGAGKMACGLLGQILSQSGFSTLFVARRSEVVDAINRWHGYSLRVAGETMEQVAIRNCAALAIQDETRVAEAVAEAGVVFTAVGIDNLAAITPAIGQGIWLRGPAGLENPLNVIACENLPGAGAYLRLKVAATAPLLRAMTVEAVAGFSAALTHRIMTGGGVENGELVFTVDADYDLILDAHGLKGALPEMRGVALTQDFPAMVIRKLYTLNLGQAVAAYLGYREGVRAIHEGAAHPRVAPVLEDALLESQAALQAELPHQAGAIARDVEDARRRIANARLADSINRVARSPLRKLSPRERLVGPARLAHDHGLPHEKLCLAIAAALAYDDPDDPQAAEMQQILRAEGIDKILTEECGILPHEELALSIKEQWRRLVEPRLPLGPFAGNLSGSEPPMERILGAVVADLSQQYDPDLVREVVDHVAKELQEARVRTYLPLLMKKEATERLKAARRKRVCFLLERGSPPRTNAVLSEALGLLAERGLEVTTLYPEEELLRLDSLAVDADLYVLKSNTELALSLALGLEVLGGRVLNTATACLTAKNKVLAAATLAQAGIPTPRSLAAARPLQLARELAHGPLILKPYRGHYGAGVAVAERPPDLPPARAYPDLVFAQEFLLRARSDLKLLVIGDEVHGVRKPFSRDSFQQPGEPVPVDPDLVQLARRCGRAFGLELFGVDVLEDESGSYVMDVNYFPGYRGVPGAARRLAEHLARAEKG